MPAAPAAPELPPLELPPPRSSGAVTVKFTAKLLPYATEGSNPGLADP